MPFEREKMLVLLTMCFALFMAMLDNTVVNVALPTLAKKLSTGVSGLQWIVDGYVLAFASLLLTGGILGDRYGRKRMFVSGLAIFTFSSLLCALSRSSGQLIAARGLQGIGASMLIPGTLSILTVTFPAHERARAIGIWAGVSGMALALGPTLGGWMVERFGWPSVFYLNVPIGVVGFFTALRTVRESRAEHARSLDLTGLGLGTADLFSVTYALIEANQLSWGNPKIIAGLVAAAIFFVAFLWWERRTEHAMLPLDYFKVPAFSAGNAVAFSVSLGMFGTFFFMSLYMQEVRGYSAFQAGLRFLAMTGMIVFAAPNAGRIASKHGSRWIMTIGLTMAGAGLLLLGRASATTPFAFFIPVLMMMGIGMGSTMTPMTAAVMNAVGPQRAGLGSATTNTSREVGGVFGIALLGTLLTTRLRSSFTAKLAGLAIPAQAKTALLATAGHGTLAPAVLAKLPPAQRLAVERAFGSSFVSGFHVALLTAAVIVLLAAFISARWIPSGAPAREPGSDPELAAAH